MSPARDVRSQAGIGVAVGWGVARGVGCGVDVALGADLSAVGVAGELWPPLSVAESLGSDVALGVDVATGVAVGSGVFVGSGRVMLRTVPTRMVSGLGILFSPKIWETVTLYRLAILVSDSPGATVCWMVSPAHSVTVNINHTASPATTIIDKLFLLADAGCTPHLRHLLCTVERKVCCRIDPILD